MYINTMPIARGFLPSWAKIFAMRFFDKTHGRLAWIFIVGLSLAPLEEDARISPVIPPVPSSSYKTVLIYCANSVKERERKFMVK
jgi:hypothetical protein